MNAFFSRRMVVLFAAALAARVAFIAVSSEGAGELHEDAVSYYSYAQGLVETGEYAAADGRRATRMPGYPLFLAGLMLCGIKSIIAIQLAQAILGAGSCVLLYLLLRLLVAENIAYAGGMTGALYFDMIRGSPRILSETFYAFVIISFFLLFNRMRKKPPSGMLLCGLCLGVGGLIRPECYLFALLMAGYVFISSGAGRFSRAALFALGFGLVIMPWIGRNYLLFQKVIPTTTTPGLNLYYGMGLTLKLMRPPQHTLVEITGKGELEQDREYMQLARQLYKSTGAGLMFKVFSRNVSILFYPFHPYYDPTLFFLLPLWVIGLWVTRGDERYRAVTLFLGVSVAAYVLMGSTVTRFRQSLAPGQIILACAGIAALYEKVDRRILAKCAWIWTGVHGFIWAAAPWIRQLALKFRDMAW